MHPKKGRHQPYDSRIIGLQETVSFSGWATWEGGFGSVSWEGAEEDPVIGWGLGVKEVVVSG